MTWSCESLFPVRMIRLQLTRPQINRKMSRNRKAYFLSTLSLSNINRDRVRTKAGTRALLPVSPAAHFRGLQGFCKHQGPHLYYAQPLTLLLFVQHVDGACGKMENFKAGTSASSAAEPRMGSDSMAVEQTVKWKTREPCSTSYPVGIATIQKAGDSKCWQGRGESESLLKGM